MRPRLTSLSGCKRRDFLSASRAQPRRRIERRGRPCHSLGSAYYGAIGTSHHEKRSKAARCGCGNFYVSWTQYGTRRDPHGNSRNVPEFCRVVWYIAAPRGSVVLPLWFFGAFAENLFSAKISFARYFPAIFYLLLSRRLNDNENSVFKLSITKTENRKKVETKMRSSILILNFNRSLLFSIIDSICALTLKQILVFFNWPPHVLAEWRESARCPR